MSASIGTWLRRRGDVRLLLRSLVAGDGLDLWIFLYLPFLLAVTYEFAFTPDDPMITLRYAANFVHGHGLTFNPGQHVQGFTSPLHLVVAIVAYVLPGAHDLFKLKIASVVFGLLLAREAGVLIHGLELPRWTRRTAFLAVAGSWVLAVSSGNGLETTLAGWLVVLLARTLILRRSPRSSVVAGVVAAMAVLARPDAALAVALLAAAGLVVERRKALWRRVAWVVGPVAAGGVLALASVVYFGDPLPNTFYAKELPLGTAIPQGYRYLEHSLQPGMVGSSWGPSWISAALLVVQLVLLAVGTATVVRRRPRYGYLLAILLATVAFNLKSGGDWMKGGRFLVPAIVPMVVVEALGILGAASAINAVVRRLRRFDGRRVGLVGHAAAGAGAVLLVVSSLYSFSVTSAPIPYTVEHAPAWEISGLDDRSLLSSGQYGSFAQLWPSLVDEVACLRRGQLVATSEIGYFGFARQDLRLLDMRGLTDKTIAKSAPATMKYTYGVFDPNWASLGSPVGWAIFQAQPAVIATFDSPPQASVFGMEYRQARVLSFGGVDLAFYVRADIQGPCPP